METDVRLVTSHFWSLRTFCLRSRSKGEQVPTFIPAGASAAIERLLVASQQHTQTHCYISDSTLKRLISRPRQSQQMELSFSANQNVRHRRGNQVKAFVIISIALVEFLGLKILISHTS